jgi:hypothetical protein
MIAFDLWSDGPERRRVHIHPAEVASVVETEDRRAYGGWNQVALITMRNGEKFKVRDDARRVAPQIALAQKEVPDGA